MNRSVMKRQMFNRGGAASFPDLSGDGKVTRKDVLMGRGVQGLAMGGPPMMDPNMMPPAAPPQMGPEQALAGAEAQGQEMGMLAAEGVMQNIDGAQDYQSLIDGIRGNQQPLEARYAELGSIVGEQDAMQTPESVLALTQPAIMMTEEGAVNSGIGELMQGIAGDTSMEGQMGEGVGGLMMAQSPEPAMQAPMMEAGNTPPVNFRQGGPVEVRGYQAGTEVKVGGGQSLNPVIAQANRDASAYQDYFAGAMDSEARAADLEEQRRMSQAQMLFDIAQAGLQFAGTTEGGSIAERLANAAAQTQLPQRIGERAAGMMAAKREQRAEDRQMRMAGLQASLQQSVVDKAAADALALAQAKVNIKCFSKEQFAIIDILYMRPGYTVLLEFGHTVYKNNAGETVYVDTAHTLPKTTLFSTGTAPSPKRLSAALLKEKEKWQGNYEGFYARITKFGWKFNNDGSYDITINLTGVGDVISSLNVMGAKSFSSPFSIDSKFEINCLNAYVLPVP